LKFWAGTFNFIF